MPYKGLLASKRYRCVFLVMTLNKWFIQVLAKYFKDTRKWLTASCFHTYNFNMYLTQAMTVNSTDCSIALKAPLGCGLILLSSDCRVHLWLTFKTVYNTTFQMVQSNRPFRSQFSLFFGGWRFIAAIHLLEWIRWKIHFFQCFSWYNFAMLCYLNTA